MHLVSYVIIRSFLYLFSFLTLNQIQLLAALLAPVCYHLIPKYRKRALSNLTLAKELNFTVDQVQDIAKKSLFHLMVTAFEYGKLHRAKSLNSICRCLNPEITDTLLDQKKGVIFLCGHQSNWELLFLDATTRHFGTCIGKPIKNKRLYNFILSIREKFLGSVIEPKNAYKGCIKALKNGEFIGIVGDQGLPESSFTYNCLGRLAHMTTLPALLSLRSAAPLYVATIVREKNNYAITYTGPITFEMQSQDPLHDITLKSLQILDEKIKQHPEQWMWQHNRWKISYKHFIPKNCRHDAIGIILPLVYPHMHQDLELLKQVYQGAYFIIFKPQSLKLELSFNEIIDYLEPKDCLIIHYGPKLLIDLADIPGAKKHFKKCAVFTYIKTTSLKKLISSWEQAHAH